MFHMTLSKLLNLIGCYTLNGYLVPAEFGVHFLPCMKNVPKRTKMHSNEVGLTNTEIC